MKNIDMIRNFSKLELADFIYSLAPDCSITECRDENCIYKNGTNCMLSSRNNILQWLNGEYSFKPESHKPIITEYIVQAAIQVKDCFGSSSLFCGKPFIERHGDIIKDVLLKFPNILTISYANVELIEGFITSEGRFVDRVEAKKIARKANQLLRDSEFSELITEDLR